MSNTDAFDWTDVKIVKHMRDADLINLSLADATRAVHRVDMVRSWYPESACAFRWTSRNCSGTVEFAYSMFGDEFKRDGRSMVCEKCAARAIRAAACLPA